LDGADNLALKSNTGVDAPAFQLNNATGNLTVSSVSVSARLMPLRARLNHRRLCVCAFDVRAVFKL
jgi:hypothetical protein